MNVGDLVKPKGGQKSKNKEMLESVKTGIIVRKAAQQYCAYSSVYYTVLWNNKTLIKHSWLEIEVL